MHVSTCSSRSLGTTSLFSNFQLISWGSRPRFAKRLRTLLCGNMNIYLLISCELQILWRMHGTTVGRKVRPWEVDKTKQTDRDLDRNSIACTTRYCCSLSQVLTKPMMPTCLTQLTFFLDAGLLAGLLKLLLLDPEQMEWNPY